MDSPLMPTLQGRTYSSQQQPGDESLLADLSLSDSLPDDSFDTYPRPTHSHSHASGSIPALAGGSLFSASRNSSQSQSQSASQSNNHLGKQIKPQPRFSLFAVPGQSSHQAEQENQREDKEDNDGGDEGDVTIDASAGNHVPVGEEETVQKDQQPAQPAISRPTAQSSLERDDKLRESLYELRKMNEVFDGFLGALEAANSHNERLSARVKQTSLLLDQYVAIMGQTEHTKQLLSNNLWTGAEDDVAALEAEEAARQAALAEQQERQRLAEERAAEESRRKAELEAEKARAKEVVTTRGGIRGRGGSIVRGSTRGRGGSIPAAPSRTTGSKIPPPTTTGLRKPSGGIAGKYKDVPSSGYGPPSKKT